MTPHSTWLLLRGGLALGQALVFVISAVYFVQTIGLSPLQLVLVGTVMELTIFVFELPTGIVADLVSRRLSVLFGTAIMGLAFVLIGSSSRRGPRAREWRSGASATHSRAARAMRGLQMRSDRRTCVPLVSSP